MNLAIVIGNLGSDPETRQTPSGKTVCNFSVATNEGRDEVEWHSIVAWEKTAELCSQYLSKGRKVSVQGRLQTRKWEQDGVTRYKTEIVAFRVEFLSPPDQQGQRQQQGGYGPPQGPPQGGYGPPQGPPQGGYGGAPPQGGGGYGGPSQGGYQQPPPQGQPSQIQPQQQGGQPQGQPPQPQQQGGQQGWRQDDIPF